MQGVAHKIALLQGISCHSWNHDRTMLALCPNSNVVLIYKVPNVNDPKAEWEVVHELKEHDQLVTAIDWAPKTNRIVTTSHDRNAYVWTYENVHGVWTWKPTLVILRVNRAATCVRWNAEETKFAVGSGTKQVPVCFFEQEHNWWVSKIIKKHKSTVLSVDWHPTAPLLVTTSSDFKCRVVCAYISGVDSSESSKTHPWSNGTKTPFGEVLQEFNCGGWVRDARWSPSGKYIAYAGHDSTISFVTVQGPDSTTQTIKRPCLPFRSILFLSDSAVVAGGYEMNPNVFTESGGQWSFKGKVDKEDTQKEAGGIRSVFQKQVGEDLKTKHQNSISEIRAMKTSGSEVTQFSSAGLDGIIVCWEAQSLEQALKNLVI
eukprot:c13556_g1_i1.p1 GENE.c13556_g1_i1~~c13556_g1_i1.p1  ORF type:complete len:389 (+),score=149.04 c13556_g1_i1:50-1168(+)